MPKKEVIKPKQKRSIATKNKLKSTAKKLFSESGYYNVTSNMIASEAGVPIGSFYNYFGNKKGLILELIKEFQDEFVDETIQKIAKHEAEVNTKEDVLANIKMLLETFLFSDKVADPFYKIIHSLQYTEPDVLALNEEIRKSKMKVLTIIISKISHIQPISNIPIKVKLIHSSAENIGLYMNLGTSFEKKHLIDETAKMLHGYLFMD